MAMTLAAIVSILGLTLAASLAGRRLRFPVCPVCAGIALTWAWMLAARSAGIAIDAALLAVLLGASVVGVAERLEAHLAAGRSPRLWKALALPSGLVAAYGVAAERWLVAAVAAQALALVAAVFLLPRRLSAPDEAAVEKLEREMKKCC
jgi:hypothetical protein